MPASSSMGMISPADVPSRNSSAASLTHMAPPRICRRPVLQE
ncbi:unnamed protein product [Linum tenue]|uniref:Uncharacterized protein n=1 Tax=Linum tenue TaxID=586396 RepID=A0AAV0PUI8_9ROSI|nr:unnamed protein product [Linum tenue]